MHDFGGKLLLLNCWATWCPPCVDEIPGLNELAKQLGPERCSGYPSSVSVDKDEQNSTAAFCSPLALPTRPHAIREENQST